MRGISSCISRCCAYEFEDAVCAMENADLITPHAVQSPPRRSSSRIARAISKRSPWTVSRVPKVQPVRVTRPYDIGFAVIQSPPDLAQLRAIRHWRENTRLAICYVEELWSAWIEQYSNSRSPVHLFKEFDHVFVNCQGSVEPLQKIIQRPVHYFGPGIDALRFRPTRRIRSTDVFYMGRRSAATHEALVRLLENREITYVFDSIQGRIAHDIRQHRELLAGTIQNARYFVVHRAKANCPDHTHGQEELGLRYFEGAAAGAVLIGSAPRSEVFQEYFDWPDAVLPMDYDCSNVAEVLADLDSQPARMDQVRLRNVVESLRRHDWCHRWSEILAQVGQPISRGVMQRAQRIEDAVGEVQELFQCGVTV